MGIVCVLLLLVPLTYHARNWFSAKADDPPAPAAKPRETVRSTWSSAVSAEAEPGTSGFASTRPVGQVIQQVSADGPELTIPQAEVRSSGARPKIEFLPPEQPAERVTTARPVDAPSVVSLEAPDRI